MQMTVFSRTQRLVGARCMGRGSQGCRRLIRLCAARAHGPAQQPVEIRQGVTTSTLFHAMLTLGQVPHWMLLLCCSSLVGKYCSISEPVVRQHWSDDALRHGL
jgi:hypothetical protein